MKVLLINNCHRQRGGADIVYFSTAQIIKDAGHEVVFFSFADDNNERTESPEYFIHSCGKLRQFRNYFCNKDAAKAIENVLLIEKPDIAHAHLMWGGMSGAIIPVLHKYRVPLIHTVHDYRMICPAYTFRNSKGEICEKCKRGRYFNCFINRCSKANLLQSLVMTSEMYYRNHKWHPAKCLDGIIYVSKFAKNKHEVIDPLFMKTKNIVLYNFTTVGLSYPPIEKDEGYYLYYGRLSHEKGVKTLVQTFNGFPDLTLKIVGTGPKENELKSISSNNIHFYGFKTGRDLYDLVRKARFVCVPSEWYENNPMTIVESYSMGVPVIGANIGGIPEILNDTQTGFLFKYGNIDSLSEAIKRCLSLSDEEYQIMKYNAIQFAKTNFEKNSYSIHLLDFYKEIIDGSKKED